MRQYFVYILANRRRHLYIGITNDLERRMFEHTSGEVRGFAWKYNMNRLVYAEDFDDIPQAIDREKQLKGWLRAKKVALIESLNPEWKDLSEE